MTLRPDWATTVRASLLHYAHALAARDGVCPSCGEDTPAGTVITYVGGLTRDPDTGRIADRPRLDGEWVCAACYSPTAMRTG